MMFTIVERSRYGSSVRRDSLNRFTPRTAVARYGSGRYFAFALGLLLWPVTGRAEENQPAPTAVEGVAVVATDAQPPAATPEAVPAAPAVEPLAVELPPSPAPGEPDEPAVVSSDEPAVVALPAESSGPVLLRFNFSGAGWREVVGWLAEETGMALHVSDVPAGTFSYFDPEPFTPDEAITRLNLFLIPQSYAIVRRGKLLSVINLGEPRSLQQLDSLAVMTPLEELDQRGDHEVVKCIVPLGVVPAEIATAELQPLTLMTAPVVLPRSNQLVITDTASKMRSVVAVLKAMSVPTVEPVQVERFDLKYVDLETVLLVAGRHLGITTGQSEGIDISVSADLTGKRLIATGTPEQVGKLSKLLEVIDVPSESSDSMAGKTLRAHPVGGDSLKSIYEVLQTILAGKSLRLSMDPRAGTIVALADEATHEEITRAIEELQAPAIEFAVVDLNRLDAYFVVSLITEMFATEESEMTSSRGGRRDDEQEVPKPSGPRVDADPANRRLFVRGTADQIRQIRQLVEGLGTQSASSSTGARDRVRLLPLSGQQRQQILEAAERFWQGENQIVIVPTPDALENGDGVIERAIHPPRSSSTPATANAVEPSTGSREALFVPTKPVRSDAPKSRIKLDAAKAESGEIGAEIAAEQELVSVSPEADEVEPARLVGTPAGGTSPIRGRLVPEGILLESEDTAALDQFQDHLMEVASANARTPSPPVVFYLKYVTADQAVKMLADLFDGGKSLATTPSGSLVRGDYGNDFYFGSFTSNRDGLTTVTAGTATIVSDARLNRLIIQGTTQDVAQIEGYLKIIDKGESLTDIETAGRSRVIELLHTKASEMAEVVKQAYAGRVANATPGQASNQPGSQQGNQPGRPGDRSGQAPPAENSDRQRGEGEQRGQREVVDKPTRDRLPDMTVAVHEPSNSLVITAPDALFAEVETLIRSVDQRGERVIEVIPAAQGVDLESILRQLQGGEASPTSSSGSGDSSRGYGGDRDRDRSDRDSRDRSRSR